MTRVYRPSQNPHLGTLPREWGEAHLTHVAAIPITNGLGEAAADGAPTWPRYIRTTDISGLFGLDADKRVTLPPEVAVAATLEAGDLLMTAAGSLGTSYLHNGVEEACYAGYLVRFRAKRARVVPRYAAWWTRSKHHLDQLELGAVRSTIDNFSAGKFRSMLIPLPDLAEQSAIAVYLDRETDQIDTLIAKQEALIETLRERHAATLALYFFGSEGKRQTSVRRVLAPLRRPSPGGLGVITAFRDGQVTLRSSRREAGYTFSESESGYQEILPGDLVFHALDGFAGAVGVSDSHGVASPVYHVCEAIAGDDVYYLAALLRFLGTSGFLATQAPNVRERSVDFRNWATFARVELALPTPAEQRAAVAEIREQTVKTEMLIAKAERFVALAKERRAALITAAVTGQIDVREAA